MAATYSLTLRSDLNRKLTIEEMDNNFLYLDNKSGGSASATLPIVTNLGTGTASYNQGNNFLGLGLTYSGQIFDTGSGGYNVIVSVDGTAADDAKDLNLFGYFEPNGDSANVSTRYDSEKSIVNIESTSLTFSAGITVGASTTHSSTFVKFSFSGVTNSFYYFPSSNPNPGEVLGYDGANQLGWVSPSGSTTSYLPLEGGTMDPNASIYFGNGGQNISKGSFDNGLGGSKGISLNCAINYELNWQAGHLSNYYNSGYVPIIFDSNIHVNGQSEISMGSTFSPSFFAGVDMLDSAYLKLKTGNEGVGKVLTSDSNGYASWKNSSILLGQKIGFDANLQSTMTNATIQYQTLVGTFSVGEIIQSDLGVTASILSDLTSILTLDAGYGDFTGSINLTGLSSGATADISVYTYLTVADQVINLSGGNKYLISQVIITNATSSVGSMGTGDQLSIWTGPSQSGYKLYDSISGIPQLATSDHFISSNAGGMGMATNVLVSDGLVYASLRVVVGATASFDIYLYGYMF